MSWTVPISHPYTPLRIGRSRTHITRLSIADPASEDVLMPFLEPDIVDRGVIVNHENAVQMTPEVYAAAGQAPLSVHLGHPHFAAALQYQHRHYLRTRKF